MKISASIYSNKIKGVEALVKELDDLKVDFLHIDCNDDLSVFDDIAIIKKMSQTPVDLHIISSNPEKYFPFLIKHQVDFVTFQHENLVTPLHLPKEIKSRIGIAIVTETPISVLEQYKERMDFILFMTTTPGKSGGLFNKENFKKIRDFKVAFPDKKIHVDGGVNDEVSFVLRNMGVYSVVSGSYLVNSNVIGHALHNLRNDNIQSHILVSDFMLTREELPVVSAEDAKLIDALISIEKYSLGFTLMLNKEGKLVGLISNADVRKGLIRKIDSLSQLKIEDVINPNPLKILNTFTISEMLTFIKNSKIPIMYLPIVDAENRLTGAITFNNLIKGE